MRRHKEFKGAAARRPYGGGNGVTFSLDDNCAALMFRFYKCLHKKGAAAKSCFYTISLRLLVRQIMPNYISIASIVPAATAVPITPATFGPMACMRR